MSEASRVQKLLNEQNAEIDRLKNRIKKLEAALDEIVKYLHGYPPADIARKALEETK